MSASMVPPGVWAGFIGFVLLMLLLDLGVFHRGIRPVRTHETLAWIGIWGILALVFNAGVWRFFGRDAGLSWFAGWVIELSLSVDNLFVFVVVFQAMRIPSQHQHKILFWGILSALILRAVMIWGGVALLEKFTWMMFIFGGFLIITGLKFFFAEDESHPEHSPVLRLIRRWLPTTELLHGGRFFAREGTRRVATPLFVTLVLIEVTDVVFAVDSIPAIFAVTTKHFLVFTSNIFAILGLRSLYFLLVRMMDKFHFLKGGLAVVLVFVGTKMFIEPWLMIPTGLSLLVILGVLTASVGASWVWASQHPPKS